MHRRGLLGLFGGIFLNPTSSNSDSTNWPTPTPPSTSPSPVISERYGSLRLGSKRPFWSWNVATDTCCAVDIDLQLADKGDSNLDILTFEEDAFKQYRDRVTQTPLTSGPVLQTKTDSLFGIQFPLPEVQSENINHLDVTEFTDGPNASAPSVVPQRIESASAPDVGSSNWSFQLGPGEYRVVFDWTNAKTQRRDATELKANLGLRARPTSEAVEDKVQRTTLSVFNSLEKNVVDALETLAETICNQETQHLTQPSAKEFASGAVSTQYVLPVLKRLLGSITSRFGTSLPLARKALNRATTWMRWSATVFPVVSSAQNVVEDACQLTTAESQTTQRAEDFLLSIGLFVADLALAQFGVASKLARGATRLADEILLGIFKQTLSTRSYLLLLRELFALFYDEAADIINGIQEITAAIAAEADVFERQERAYIRNLDEKDVFSPETGFLDGDSGCQSFDGLSRESV